MAWNMLCRLFAGGTPVLYAMLPPRDIAALPVLGKAIRPAMVDQSCALCPHCGQHRGQVWSDGSGGRICRCPVCGPVIVEDEDVAALALDEDWLRQNVRVALDIHSRDNIDDLGNGVWRLGHDRCRSPVLLARDLVRLWQEPTLLDRVRVNGSGTRVITPRSDMVRGAPFGAGVQWLALEDRFTFADGAIVLLGEPALASATAVADAVVSVHGPFSVDFQWARLADIGSAPIRFTEGQAKVFKALWSFKGKAVTADRIMRHAGLGSAKPGDLFKIRNKGKPESVAQHAAYGALVVTHKRAGLYSMPCATGSSL
jgi:hypothetical protein